MGWISESRELLNFYWQRHDKIQSLINVLRWEKIQITACNQWWGPHMIAFRLWKNSFSLPTRYILITSLPTYHFLKYQTLVTSWKQDNGEVRPLTEGTTCLCVSSSDAQGHDNGQIWGRKSILLQKIVRQGSWEFFSLSSARSAVCRLEFLIFPGAFRVQILGCLFFASGAQLFLPRAETLSITVVFGTCTNSNNSLRPIKGHHCPS